MSPLAEPAVIQYHHAHPQACSLLGDVVDLVLVKVEVGGLPVVDQHLAGLVGGAAAEGLPDEPMVVVGQVTETLVGVAQQHLGGGKGFTGVQQPPEPIGVDAGDQTGGAVEIHLNVVQWLPE